MKIRHFHIRLTKENVHEDENVVNSFLENVNVKKTTTQYVTTGQTGYWSILVFYDELENIEAQFISETVKNAPFDPSALNGDERHRYEALRIWRADTAAKDNFPNYIVASNAQLGAIAKLNPSGIEQLANIKGFGERKMKKYGDEIIAVLNSI